jgi:hypothetical protein
MGFFDTLRLTIWWFLRSVTVFQPQSPFFSLSHGFSASECSQTRRQSFRKASSVICSIK